MILTCQRKIVPYKKLRSFLIKYNFQPPVHLEKLPRLIEVKSPKNKGAYWELNPGPLTYSSKEPKARIIPLDHTPVFLINFVVSETVII